MVWKAAMGRLTRMSGGEFVSVVGGDWERGWRAYSRA